MVWFLLVMFREIASRGKRHILLGYNWQYSIILHLLLQFKVKKERAGFSVV